MRAALLVLAPLLAFGTVGFVACGGSEPPAAAPCPTIASAAPAPCPSPTVSAAPVASAEPADPNVTRGVIGDAECLRYAPGYPEYLGIHCVLATGPGGHPEFVFQSVTHPDLFIRVDTAEATVEGIDREAGLRFPRVWVDRVVDCFDDAIAKDPKLAGTVTVSYEIDKDGRPQKVKAGGGTLKQPAVVACATKLVSKLHYPPPDASKPAPKVTFTAGFRTSTHSTNESK